MGHQIIALTVQLKQVSGEMIHLFKRWQIKPKHARIQVTSSKVLLIHRASKTKEASTKTERTDQIRRHKTKMKNGRKILPSRKSLTKRKWQIQNDCGVVSIRHGHCILQHSAESRKQEKKKKSRKNSGSQRSQCTNTRGTQINPHFATVGANLAQIASQDK